MTVTDAPTRWYHGTTPGKAVMIWESGAFHLGTWFASDYRDAVAFGGPYVFVVEMEIDHAPLGWQLHLANALPTSAIVEEIRP